MNKRISMILALVLVLAMLAGCAPVTVVIGNTAPATDPTSPTETKPVNPDGTALKTGLSIMTSVGGSKDAEKAEFDVSLVAVTVDDKGVIQSCLIDGIKANVAFDNTGKITSDLNAPVKTKNELGDDYGMKKYGNAKYEWYELAGALAKFAEGKTVDQLKNGAIDETGKAPAGSDLASSATIYLGGMVSGIEQAVKNAKNLGAKQGDILKLASVNSVAKSASAGEKDGTAQLDSTVTAMTMRGDTITSCYIDAVQAKVSFDAAGRLTSDIKAPVPTKNELGDKYGMVAWGGAKHEWNEQAASFAAYVTGKTPAQVQNIAVTEGKPADADLSSSVTISIGGFQELIAKAAK